MHGRQPPHRAMFVWVLLLALAAQPAAAASASDIAAEVVPWVILALLVVGIVYCVRKCCTRGGCCYNCFNKSGYTPASEMEAHPVK